jgi:hypothetical protein
MDNDLKNAKLWRLLEGSRLIMETLNEASEELLMLHKSTCVPLHNILSTADQIHYALHAPPGHKIGFPLINCVPPAPQSEDMRSGALAAHNLIIQSKLNKSVVKKWSENEKARQFVETLRTELKNKRKRMFEKSVDNPETYSFIENHDGVSNVIVAEPILPSAIAVEKKSRVVQMAFGGDDSDDESD